jgi:hypothetical protein
MGKKEKLVMKRKPLRQRYEMPYEQKMAKYKEQMTEKEKGKYIRRIVRALADLNITASEHEAEQIMWTPHLVIREIKGKTVYDPTQPLCFSEGKSLGHRAVIAYENYRRSTDQREERRTA